MFFYDLSGCGFESLTVTYNTLNSGIPGDKQNLVWMIKDLAFLSNSTLSYIFVLCGTNNIDHNSPEEIVSGLNSSGVSTQAQCHRGKVLIISLLPRDTKFSFEERK